MWPYMEMYGLISVDARQLVSNKNSTEFTQLISCHLVGTCMDINVLSGDIQQDILCDTQLVTAGKIALF